MNEDLPAESTIQTPTIVGWISQSLRDSRVPSPKVATVATKIQKLFRDTALPVSRRMHKTDGNIFRKNSKAIWIVGSPARRSRSVYTDVSSDQVKDCKDKNKYREKKRHTYREKIMYRATEAAQRDQSPQTKLRPAEKGVNQNLKRDRDKNRKTYRATASPRLTPSLQESRKPNNTEKSNRIENPKAPSVFQASLGAVQTLEIATVTTRFQELSRDIRVPVAISWRMYKIDKIIYKLESNRAVGSPLGNPQTVNTKVSNSPAGNSDEKRKTHCKNKKKTHRIREPDKKSDPGRPPEGQNTQLQYIFDWASEPANRRNQDSRQYYKIEWAYKPATNERNKKGKVIGLTRHDSPDETKSGPATEGVSYDHHKEKTYRELPRFRSCDGDREENYPERSRFGNRDGGEPGQGFCRECKIHQAFRLDRRFENKNENTQKKNKRETYLEESEESRNEEICGEEPDEGREPSQRTRLNWACRPISGGDKNENKKRSKEECPSV